MEHAVERIDYRQVCASDTAWSVCGRATYFLVDGEPMCAACRKANGISTTNRTHHRSTK